jgi:uncharacterized membrane protein YeaQ/YmgE (transglycosylase-associated protein family)
MLAGILSFTALGLLIGLTSCAIDEVECEKRAPSAALLGLVGAFVGALVANLLAGEPALQIPGAGIIGSLLGSLLLVCIGVSLRKRARLLAARHGMTRDVARSA